MDSRFILPQSRSFLLCFNRTDKLMLIKTNERRRGRQALIANYDHDPYARRLFLFPGKERDGSKSVRRDREIEMPINANEQALRSRLATPIRASPSRSRKPRFAAERRAFGIGFFVRSSRHQCECKLLISRSPVRRGWMDTGAG